MNEVQRPIIAGALEQLAGSDWKYSEKVPDKWKEACFTYLKAWACSLNPTVLSDMAELLVRAGYKGEAKQALQVVLLFPTYSREYFTGGTSGDELTRQIVEDAKKALAAL